MKGSNYDKLYKSIFYFKKMFSNGWGSHEHILKLIAKYKGYQRYLLDLHIDHVNMFAMNVEKTKTFSINHFQFSSPFKDYFPDILDDNNSIARYMLLEPLSYRTDYKPLVIHFPRTSDEKYNFRRSCLGEPLAKEGIASILYTNPFYGERKPKSQKSVYLNNVVDLFISGAVVMIEAQYIIKWAKNQGFYPIALHGLSKGGHMSTLATCVHNEPICNIPCLSWTTGSTAFIEGVLNYAINWEVLTQQYHSNDVYRNEILPLLHPINSLPQQVSAHPEPKDTKVAIKSSIDSEMILDIPSRPKSTSKISSYLPINLKDTLSKISNLSVFKNKEIDPQSIEETQSMVFLSNQQFKPPVKPNGKGIDLETLNFFHSLMNHFTHLENYPEPTDPRLTTFVLAERDAFFPVEMMPHINDLWSINEPDKRCQVRILQGQGHVDSFLLNYLYKREFMNAIIDTLNRYVELYEGKPGPFELRK